MQLCSSIILKFSTTFESTPHCQTDCQVEPLFVLCNILKLHSSDITGSTEMTHGKLFTHFRTKADYKKVSIVLAAHSKEQKSNSRLSSIPTKQLFTHPSKCNSPQGPLQALLIGLHAAWKYGMIIRYFHCF